MKTLYMLNWVSIDGFFAGVNGGIDWVIPDNEITKASHEIIHSDTLVMGRVTYQDMASFWPHVQTDPKAAPEMKQLADEVINTPKIVFSKTLQAPAMENTQIIRNDPVDEIRKLKQGSGAGMLIMGSGSIVQPLTEAGLIDEYIIQITPVLLGQGKPLFKADTKRLLDLVSGTSTDAGSVLLHYKKK